MAEARDVDERSGRRAEDIAGGGYQKVALDLMNALATDTPARMILNVGNGDGGFSSIPTLRDTDVVEVPCDVDASGVHPIPVAPLSGAALGLVQSVKACENLVIDAARERIAAQVAKNAEQASANAEQVAEELQAEAAVEQAVEQVEETAEEEQKAE